MYKSTLFSKEKAEEQNHLSVSTTAQHDLTIIVHSFDFDGCLFNLKYIYSEDKDVIFHNQPLLDGIKKNTKPNDKQIIFIGSNRQDKDIDDINAEVRDKGSCFPAIAKISLELNAKFDPFLLADVYGNKPSGTAYMKAMNALYSNDDEQEEHDFWIFDEEKLTILYAQMHKVASENPNISIEFNFYDDRRIDRKGNIDILEYLSAWFQKYPEMIPYNISLNLNHYEGGPVTNIVSINGEGEIDFNYRQTIKQMAEISISEDSTSIHAVKHVTPQNLVNLVSNKQNSSMDENGLEEEEVVVEVEEVDIEIEEIEKIDPLVKKSDRIRNFIMRKFGHFSAKETKYSNSEFEYGIVTKTSQR